MGENRAEATVRDSGRRHTGTAPRLYERAIDMLSDRITRGILAAGDQITETSLADQLGISRAPARRALIELERRGLIARAKGRGYAVLPCDGAPVPERTDVLPPEETVPLLSLPSWELIYGEVENEIVARTSFADWRVNEVKLARHYHVSRTVARDVVGRLQQRGIVRKDDSSRWVAQALSHDHINELYELRAILEPVALVKAASGLPADFLSGIQASLAAAMADESTTDGATLDRLEEELHVTLLGHCGNQALMQAITQPQSLLIAHRFLYRWTPRMFAREPFLPEHKEVLDRLQGGDPRGAAAALERHLQVSGDRAVARVDQIRREFNVDDLPYLEPVK